MCDDCHANHEHNPEHRFIMERPSDQVGPWFMIWDSSTRVIANQDRLMFSMRSTIPGAEQTAEALLYLLNEGEQDGI